MAVTDTSKIPWGATGSGDGAESAGAGAELAQCTSASVCLPGEPENGVAEHNSILLQRRGSRCKTDAVPQP